MQNRLLSVRVSPPERPDLQQLSARLDDGEVGTFDLQEMLAYPEHQRDINWLKVLLQHAVQLEFATIPPYLTAFWSVKDTSSSTVPNIILSIALQEMLHMGIVCNILTSLGQSPVIYNPAVVPKYPCHLPGGVHPRLCIELKPLSKDLIANTFMKIEEPETRRVQFAFGQTYPTVGAFYTAIQECIRRLPGNIFMGARQVVLCRPGFQLKAINTANDALDGIELIKEQGEGESGSPLYGPSPEDMAHYFLFGEIYHEKELVNVAPNEWQYTGNPIPFPSANEIYPMAPIPKDGYPESLPFDQEFTHLLYQLQKAWDSGGQVGGDWLEKAQETMDKLGKLAVELMKTPITPGSQQTMGPCFRFVR